MVEVEVMYVKSHVVEPCSLSAGFIGSFLSGPLRIHRRAECKVHSSYSTTEWEGPFTAMVTVAAR